MDAGAGKKKQRPTKPKPRAAGLPAESARFVGFSREWLDDERRQAGQR